MSNDRKKTGDGIHTLARSARWSCEIRYDGREGRSRSLVMSQGKFDKNRALALFHEHAEANNVVHGKVECDRVRHGPPECLLPPCDMIILIRTDGDVEVLAGEQAGRLLFDLYLVREGVS